MVSFDRACTYCTFYKCAKFPAEYVDPHRLLLFIFATFPTLNLAQSRYKCKHWQKDAKTHLKHIKKEKKDTITTNWTNKISMPTRAPHKEIPMELSDTV